MKANTAAASSPFPSSAPFRSPFPKRTGLSYADGGSTFSFEGVRVTLPQPGAFSVRNALAAMHAAAFLGISVAASAKTLGKLTHIKGRAEAIDEGQEFAAIVDYAHTPDSLMALYDAYPQRKICVLGNTGGGRDIWKRPEMGPHRRWPCARRSS